MKTIQAIIFGDHLALFINEEISKVGLSLIYLEDINCQVLRKHI